MLGQRDYSVCFAPGTCPPLAAPVDGFVYYDYDAEGNGEYLAGTLAYFSCDSGFELFGEAARMCQHNMTWTNSQPNCLSE